MRDGLILSAAQSCIIIVNIAGNGLQPGEAQAVLFFPDPKERSKKMLQAMEYILLILLVIIAWCMIYNKLTSGKEKEEV